MSPVDFKKYPCRMSLYFVKPCRMSIGSMSHVKFKKLPYCPIEFKGQGPFVGVYYGALDWGGGVPCHMSILRKAHVTCH